MGECRFDGSSCQAHYSFHALCSYAAADLERRIEEQKALTENAWKVANDQARQREDLERRLEAQATSIKTYQQVCARLEEEKAQAEEKHKGDIRYLRAQYDSVVVMKDQAEAREAAMRGALEKVRLRFKEFWDDRYVAICDAALSPDAGRALTEECEVCHGKAFWLSKEGAEIPCERCGHLSKTAVYFIAVEPDGTWLILNGGRRRAAIRLEDAAHGPIVKAAIAEVRYALGKRGKEGGE